MKMIPQCQIVADEEKWVVGVGRGITADVGVLLHGNHLENASSFRIRPTKFTTGFLSVPNHFLNSDFQLLTRDEGTTRRHFRLIRML